MAPNRQDRMSAQCVRLYPRKMQKPSMKGLASLDTKAVKGVWIAVVSAHKVKV